MSDWFLILSLISIVYLCIKAYGSVLLNKEVLIKRFNPTPFKLVGDLSFRGNIFTVKFQTKARVFSLQQISNIRAYCLADWGLSEYEQIDILFDEKYKVKLDGSMEEHRQFIKFLLSELGVEEIEPDWGFLPQLNDKMDRDIIFIKK